MSLKNTYARKNFWCPFVTCIFLTISFNEIDLYYRLFFKFSLIFIHGSYSTDSLEKYGRFSFDS